MSQTMLSGVKFSLCEARVLAEALVASMKPHCVRVEIAGSVRRGKPEIGDIEIVAVPRWSEGSAVGLFDERPRVNRLHQWATIQADLEFGVQWIKPGTSDIVPWPIQPNGKYWRGYVASPGIKLDLFLAAPENYGVIQLIRTGDAAFSQEIVTHALRVGMRFEGGRLYRSEAGGHLTLPVNAPNEQSVFDALGLRFVLPEKRMGAAAVWRSQKEVAL